MDFRQNEGAKCVPLFLIAKKQSEEPLAYLECAGQGPEGKAGRIAYIAGAKRGGFTLPPLRKAKRLDFIESLINLGFLGGFL